MVKSIYTERYGSLRSVLITERKKAGLSQQALANKLGKPQSFVSKFEMGERRLDVIEFLEIIRAIGVDPCSVLKILEQVEIAPTKNRKRT